jgi:radical SAM superfamily enzyme YgiQ (UPF0313 family)
VVVRGHGEIPFREFLGLNPNRQGLGGMKEEISRIDGVCFKYQDGGSERYHISPPFLHTPKTISSLPVPAYELFPFDRYDLSRADVPVYTSKGCAYSCKFCSVPAFEGRKMLFLPLSKTRETLKKLAWLGAKRIFISDPDFNLDRKHALAVCNLIASMKESKELPCDITFSCQARIDLLDAGLIMRMRKAGFSRAYIGIESISYRVVQQDIGKCLRLKQKGVERMLEKVKDAGITPFCYLILGTPGTKMDDLDKNIDFIRRRIGKGYEMEVNTFVRAFPEAGYFQENKQRINFIRTPLLRVCNGLVRITQHRMPCVIRPRDRQVYRRLLRLRNRANQLVRKDHSLTFEKALLKVASTS